MCYFTLDIFAKSCVHRTPYCYPRSIFDGINGVSAARISERANRGTGERRRWRSYTGWFGRERINVSRPINGHGSRLFHGFFFPIKSSRMTGGRIGFVSPFLPDSLPDVYCSGMVVKLIGIRSHPRRRKLETTLRN